MSACVLEIGRGFFEVVCAPSYATAYFCDPPHPSIRESHLRRRSIQTLAWLSHSYVVCCSFEAVSGRSHSETWAGCIVSFTTPTTSLLRACRSVSSLSLTEKPSRLFLASYLLRKKRLSMKDCTRLRSGVNRAA